MRMLFEGCPALIIERVDDWIIVSSHVNSFWGGCSIKSGFIGADVAFVARQG